MPYLTHGLFEIGIEINEDLQMSEGPDQRSKILCDIVAYHLNNKA